MTIAMAWIRRIRDCEELIFVTDSRLSGDGRTFDASPKIVVLPRGDCAIAFAGGTQDAFPMMLQLSLAISSHTPMRRRSLDIGKLKSHALKIFDGMVELITNEIKGAAPPEEKSDLEFLFGGYSWEKKAFQLWTVHFSSERRFIAEPARWAAYSPGAKKVVFINSKRPRPHNLLGQVALAGDQKRVAQEMLSRKLTSDYLARKGDSKINMQPFETVRDMLRDPKRSHTIGGSPQLVKVYQFMQAVPFAVFWPDRGTGRPFLQGRPCLGYERLDTRIIDPDRPTLKPSSGGKPAITTES